MTKPKKPKKKPVEAWVYFSKNRSIMFFSAYQEKPKDNFDVPGEWVRFNLVDGNEMNCTKSKCTNKAKYYGAIGGYGKFCKKHASEKSMKQRMRRRRNDSGEMTQENKFKASLGRLISSMDPDLKRLILLHSTAFNKAFIMEMKQIALDAKRVGKIEVCGLCNEPGADKVPHPVYWPGEEIPGTEYVHASCEEMETKRAYSLLSDEQRADFFENFMTKPTDITDDEIDGLMSYLGDLGCNDHSCLFTRQKGGQKTNGGCRCLMGTPHSIRRFIQASNAIIPKLFQAYKKQKIEIEKMEEALKWL